MARTPRRKVGLIKGGMRGGFAFYLQAVCLGMGWGWGVIGTISTALWLLPSLVAATLPNLATWEWIRWLADHPVRAAGYGFTTAVVVYLFWAPYALARRREEEHGAEAASLRQEIESLRNERKLSVSVLSSKRRLICARVVNSGDREERILSLEMHVTAADGYVETFGKIHKLYRCDKINHPMPPRSSFEAEFLLSMGTFQAYGIKSYFCRVILEDMTEIDSPTQDVEWNRTSVANEVRVLLTEGEDILEELRKRTTSQEKECADDWLADVSSFAFNKIEDKRWRDKFRQMPEIGLDDLHFKVKHEGLGIEYDTKHNERTQRVENFVRLLSEFQQTL